MNVNSTVSVSIKVISDLFGFLFISYKGIFYDCTIMALSIIIFVLLENLSILDTTF